MEIKPQVKHILDKVAETSRQAMQQTGSQSPIFLIGRGSDIIHVILATFRNEREKNQMAEAIKNICQEVDADFLIFVAESWAYSGEDAEAKIAKYGSVSKIPEAQEVVSITYESVGYNVAATAPIKDKKVGEFDWMELSGVGRFSNLLPKRAIH